MGPSRRCDPCDISEELKLFGMTRKRETGDDGLPHLEQDIGRNEETSWADIARHQVDGFIPVLRDELDRRGSSSAHLETQLRQRHILPLTTL